VPKSTLTRRQRWAPYVRQLADILHLRDWSIDVSEESSSGDSTASCEPVNGRKLAIIRFSESFLTAPVVDQRHTITHELLHCQLGPLHRLLEANEFMRPSVLLALEYAVDGLADAIAPLLPEPPPSTRSQS
jgi:hypothetical protein